jgi:hypothetical protein
MIKHFYFEKVGLQNFKAEKINLSLNFSLQVYSSIFLGLEFVKTKATSLLNLHQPISLIPI